MSASMATVHAPIPARSSFSSHGRSFSRDARGFSGWHSLDVVEMVLMVVGCEEVGVEIAGVIEARRLKRTTMIKPGKNRGF